MHIAEQFSRLQVDQFGHILVQDQVFKCLASVRRTKYEHEEAEVGKDESNLNTQCQDQEWSRIRLRPLSL